MTTTPTESVETRLAFYMDGVQHKPQHNHTDEDQNNGYKHLGCEFYWDVGSLAEHTEGLVSR